jgi:hypothetical protein
MKSSSYYHKAEGNVINLPSPRKISVTGIRDEDLFEIVSYIRSLASQRWEIMKFAETTDTVADGVTSRHLIFA